LKKLLCLALALAWLPACRSARSPASSPKSSAVSRSALDRVFKAYYRDRLKLYPLEATSAGNVEFNGSLSNTLTDSYRSNAAAIFQKHLTAVSRWEGGDLSAEDQIGCDVLRWECEMGLKQLQFPTSLLPINQFESLHLTIGQWAGGTSAQPFKTVRDYENWVKRIVSGRKRN